MAKIRLRDASGEREVDQTQLFAAMTAGRADIQGQVQQVEGGPWISAGAWYLDSSTIAPPGDTDGRRYLDSHVVRGLDVGSVLSFLGVPPAVAGVLTPVQRSAEAIVLPAWADSSWGREHVVHGIDLPPWHPDPTGEIAASIHVPSWGAPFALPVVDDIVIPRWRDPAEEGYFELPPTQKVVWRRLSIDTDIPEPPKTQRASAHAQLRDRHKPRRRKVADSRRSPAKRTRQRTPVQPTEPTRAPAPPVSEPVATRTPVEPRPSRSMPAPTEQAADVAKPAATVTKGLGLFGCVGQVVGLLGLMLVVALFVDLGLQRVVSELRDLDIGARVAAHKVAVRRELPPMLTEGPSDSWLHVVMAADLGQAADVRAVGRLLARLEAAAAEQSLPDGQPPRLVFLPVIGDTPESAALATAILALSRQAAFWPWLRRVAADGEAVKVADIEAGLASMDVDPDRWRADRAGPDTALRSRTWSTMAAGLRLSSGTAAINGRLLAGQQLASDAAVDGALYAALHAVREARRDNDDERAAVHAALLADLPDRTAQRWQQWIVRGERVPTRPLPTSQVAARDPAAQAPVKRVDIQVPSGAATMGSPKAPVTVLVFIDFHCPYSRRHAKTYMKLIKEFGADIRLAVAHFPITALHADAEKAATLAIGAQFQGLFWPTHDLLFERADRDWSDRATVDELAELAKGAGMRVRRARLRTHRKRRAARIVAAHRKLGRKHGVNGTPYTFINGRPLRGAVAYDKLHALVTAELAAATTDQDPPAAADEPVKDSP